MATTKVPKVRTTDSRRHSIRQDSFKATVVLDKDGKYVATVKSYQPASGVTINVVQTAEAAKRCVDAGFVQLVVAQYDTPFEFQSDKATGYGYDKHSQALAGMVIDGHKMADNSGGNLPHPDGKQGFPQDFKPPAGYHLANWNDGSQTYSHCYKAVGVRYLEQIGYTLIDVS